MDGLWRCRSWCRLDGTRSSFAAGRLPSDGALDVQVHVQCCGRHLHVIPGRGEQPGCRKLQEPCGG